MNPRDGWFRKRRVLLSAGVVGVVIVGAGAMVFGLAGRGDGASARSTLPPNTEVVSRTTLVATKKVDAVLGYADAVELVGRLQGTITSLAPVGNTVAQGQDLYTVDDKPVVLMYGDKPLFRTLNIGVKGTDVKQLEENLRALGVTKIVPDETFSATTVTAVKALQKRLGLEQTGQIEIGQVVFRPSAVRVSEHKARVGDSTQPGTPVLSYSGTSRIVTIDLDTRYQSLAKQDGKVMVTLPDGKRVEGTVSAIGTAVKKDDSTGSNGKSTVSITVTVADQQALGTLSQAPVSVAFTSEERKDVLVVPIAALLALREGGYGVQVVAGAAATIVKVEVGMFAGGQVEITGAGISEGTRVGVPTP